MPNDKTILGFHPNNKPKQQKIEEKNEGKWVKKIGKPVRVDTLHNNYLGFLESTNFEKTYLNPSIILEPVGNDLTFRLETEEPIELETSAIMGIVPQTKTYFERLVNYTKGIIGG